MIILTVDYNGNWSQIFLLVASSIRWLTSQSLNCLFIRLVSCNSWVFRMHSTQRPYHALQLVTRQIFELLVFRACFSCVLSTLNLLNQEMIRLMRENRFPAAFKCYHNLHKIDSASSDNLFYRMVIHVHSDSAFRRYQKKMRCWWNCYSFIGVGLAPLFSFNSFIIIF